MIKPSSYRFTESVALLAAISGPAVHGGKARRRRNSTPYRTANCLQLLSAVFGQNSRRG